jgi:hypothetical protein
MKRANTGAVLNFDLYTLTFKSRSNEEPSYHVMYPY